MNDCFGDTLNEFKILKTDIIQKLNKARGRYFVYLLIKNDDVIYVGRSFNLFSRLSYHKYDKDFDAIYLCEYKTYLQCCFHEKQITKYYKPILNLLWVKYGI